MAGRVAYYGGIVTNGLVLDLDAAKKDSYPGTGTTWRDISGNQNNGTLVNGPTFDSNNGGSIVFDGSNDYVDCGGAKITSGSFTFSSWAKLNSISGAQVIISQGTSALGSNNYIAFRNNLFQFSTDGSATVASSNETPIINIWYNIVGVYNSTITIKNTIYINSIVQTSNSTANAIFSNNLTSIGRSPFGSGSAFFNGNIAQTLVYNRALSAQEVLQNYNATKQRYGL